MKKWTIGCLLAALPILSTGVAAHESEAADVHVMAPWSRELPPVAKNGVVYLSLRNHGRSTDRLVAASTPVAGRVELHQHVMQQGVAHMSKVESLELPPDTPVVLQPGGMHLMLIGLKSPLVEGERFALELEFALSGRKQVEVEVLAPDAVGAGYPAHGQHGSNAHMTMAMPAMPGAAASGAEPKVFELDIVKGKIGEVEPVLQVTQGDTVELRLTSDEQLTVHMHGYNIELGVTPGKRADMRVAASRTGRFPVLNHDANPPYVLLYMDVVAK